MLFASQLRAANHLAHSYSANFKMRLDFFLDLQRFLILERTAFLCNSVCFGNVYTLVTVEEMAFSLVGGAVTSVKLKMVYH